MRTPIQRTILVFALLSMPVTLHSLADYISVSGYGSIGSSHMIMGSSGMNLAVGYNNLLSNNYSAAIGYSLQNSSIYSTVLGKYNIDTPYSLLVVGNGYYESYPTPAAIRRNALEVMDSGAVRVPLIPYTGGSQVTIGTSAFPVNSTSIKVYGIADIDRVPMKGGISMGAYQ